MLLKLFVVFEAVFPGLLIIVCLFGSLHFGA